jgi:hypothetical protein
MKYYILLLLFPFLLLACKSKKQGDHISPAVMSKVLVDIHIAEAYSTMVKDSLHKGNSKNMDSLAYYYKNIFAHYRITQDQFDKTIEWYRQNPEEFDSAYANVIPALTKMQENKGK